ncbi:MAG: tyrosine-protein kinase family protein [Alphaproteobacteria bacterium]|nr:tyrosine-protein kinase family protein [Alphaproteobacteria bacterium]
MSVRFDSSLSILTAILSRRFSPEQVARAALIRDASGRLSAIMADRMGAEVLGEVATEIRDELKTYARPDATIRDADATGARRLLDEAAQVPPVIVNDMAIRLLDRRIVGSEWLKPPARTATGIPRVVFASVKGGVGRSTALSVVAAHLSQRGRRVLVVDFDLEAPGLGTMLLNEDAMPPFGTLDYLVENGLSDIDGTFLADMSGDSFLGSEGGRVAVIPAVGKATFDNASSALSKIARAYLDKPDDSGSVLTLTDQLRQMIGLFEATGAYDAVLIDARAGLHETTPAAILGLGADVLLFGTDQPQTFLGYRLLFAALARFPVDPEDDWRERLNFVHAKASDDDDKLKTASERFTSLYNLLIAPARPAHEEIEPLTAADFDVEWTDATPQDDEPFSPPQILRVLDDARYRDFDPLSDRRLLETGTRAATFADLIAYIDGAVP